LSENSICGDFEAAIDGHAVLPFVTLGAAFETRMPMVTL
jgi:hypothetical protein